MNDFFIMSVVLGAACIGAAVVCHLRKEAAGLVSLLVVFGVAFMGGGVLSGWPPDTGIIYNS